MLPLAPRGHVGYRTLAALALVALLVLSQASLLVHQSDLDAHQGEVPCQICLHAHGLDHGLSVPVLTFTVVAAHELFMGAAIDHALPTATASYQPRAPPRFFSS